MPGDLRSHAILVADMVGYSRWLAVDPVRTHRAFADHLTSIFRPSVAAHAGRFVKTTGDGLVAIFDTCDEGEACAREIQSAVGRANARDEPDTLLAYRICVHHGEIFVEPSDIFGIAVNAAMHMQSLAPAGGVCLSGEVFARLDPARQQLYAHQGTKYLKNIPTPLDVYHGRTRSQAAQGIGIPQQLPALRRNFLSPPPALGIAHLEVFQEGVGVLRQVVRDALTHGMSRFRDLFTGVPLDIEATENTRRPRFRQELADHLGLQYLLHGSLLVDDRQATIAMHLESLKDRVLIWSHRVRCVAEPAVIDREIIDEFVAPVVLYVQRYEVETWERSLRSDDENRFHRARGLVDQGTLPALGQACRLLTGILERSGEIGDVHIALARAEHSQGKLLAGGAFVDALERARSHAQKAIDLDDLNPRAHAELALQEMFLRRHAKAAEIYGRALRLNPFDSMLQADWGDCLVLMGRPDEAVPILDKVLAGWPSDRNWAEWNLCDAEWALGRPDRVIEILKHGPDQPHVHRYLAASHAKLGNMTEARRHAEKVRAHQPNFSTAAWAEVVPHTEHDAAADYADHLARAGL